MVPDAENLTDLSCNTIDLLIDNINCRSPLLLYSNETRLEIFFVVRALINCVKSAKLLETAGDLDKFYRFTLVLPSNDFVVRDLVVMDLSFSGLEELIDNQTVLN